MKALIASIVFFACSWMAASVFAANSVRIETRGGERCVISNGTPTHAIGQFPNRGNPHQFRAQAMTICVDASPRDTGRITRKTNASGVSQTGILFRPGTADFYDPGSRRGLSCNPASGWRLEGIGAADKLGMDLANAHVDHRGAPLMAHLLAMRRMGLRSIISDQTPPLLGS